MMKLYVFEHCPFCVKARMIFGLKDISIDLVYLLSDDEETPIKMIGKKMVPILVKENGEFIPESMDIVHYVDSQYKPKVVVGSDNGLISVWLEEMLPTLNCLRMPRMPLLPFPEFKEESARIYFTQKKEAFFESSFKDMMIETPDLLERLNRSLPVLANLIQSEDACNGALSNDDFHVFAALHGMSMVKGVIYPEMLELYRQNMARKTRIKLCDDLAV